MRDGALVYAQENICLEFLDKPVLKWNKLPHLFRFYFSEH